MMKNSLSDSEEVMLKEWYEEGLRWGRCTDPADKPRAEAAFRAMCDAVGTPCKGVLWFSGPAVGAMAAFVLSGGQLHAQLHDQLRAQLDSQLHDQLDAQIHDQLRAQLDAQLDSQLHDQLRAQLDAQLHDQLHAQLHDQLHAQLHDQLHAQLGDKINHLWATQFWLGWWWYLAFPRKLAGFSYDAECSRRLDMWIDVARSCCWWWAMDGYIIATDRPESIVVNGTGRLHNESGPAMRTRDGIELWSIDGVSLPWQHGQQIVMSPATQTIAEISGEKNEEIRRVRIERFGWTRYLDESGSRVVDTRRNDIDTQRESLYQTPDGRKRLRVRDPSTGREYALGVPREVSTCEQAQNYLSHRLSARCIGRT